VKTRWVARSAFRELIASEWLGWQEFHEKREIFFLKRNLFYAACANGKRLKVLSRGATVAGKSEKYH
jgi:hypothetical protein